MVRFPSAARAPRRPVGNLPHHGRRLLRRLLDENLSLMRELDELRTLRRLAHEDALTGLPNRRLLQRRLSAELSRAEPEVALRGVLLVVDVNDLKVVDDLPGHSAGDGALREVLRRALRPEDVCCRTGGDEFIILLPDTDARGARQIMARLRAAIIRVGARNNLPISISVGSAAWPADGRTAGELIEHAEGAMLAEKRRLRGQARRKPPAPGTVRKLSLVK